MRRKRRNTGVMCLVCLELMPLGLFTKNRLGVKGCESFKILAQCLSVLKPSQFFWVNYSDVRLRQPQLGI